MPRATPEVLALNHHHGIASNKHTSVVPALVFFLFKKIVFGLVIFFKKKSTGFNSSPCLSVCKTTGKRVAVIALLLWTSVASQCFAANTQADQQAVYSIKLPAQSVAKSLTALSEQTDQMLLFPYAVAETLRANPVAGRYTLRQALDIMLAGTGYSGGLTKKGVLMISLKKSNTPDQNSEGNNMINSRKKLLASTIAFFVGAGGASQVLGQESGE